MTGVGSKWTNKCNLFVGKDGAGSLTVTDGGTVVVIDAIFTSLNNLLGNGTISAQGGVLDANFVFDAVHGTQNSFTFGSGGTLTITQRGGDLGAGYKGTGTIRIADGVAVDSDIGYLGYNSGSSGTATVTGNGSKWSNYIGIYVGMSGTGTLNIEAGGQVSNTCDNTHSYIGYNSGSSGTVTVTGAGSKWTSNGNLFVGRDGSGTLTVNEGGTVVVGGTIFTSLNNLLGNGTVSANGGVVDADLVFDAAHGTQNSLIFGSGGTLSVNQSANSPLGVGYKGIGTMSITEGVNVSSSKGYLGYYSGSSGTVTITGIGSKWTNSGDLYIGYDGVGVLNIGDGIASNGAVVAKTITLANSSSASGTCNLNSGTLQTASISKGLGTAILNWNDGTIRNYDANTNLAMRYLTLNLAATGTHAFYLDAGRTGGVLAILKDATNGGTLEKQGDGLLTLYGPNTYTGSTAIVAGTLALDYYYGSLASSPIDVRSGATFDVSAKKGYVLAAGKTLTGSGTIVGDLSVSGVHAPGNSTGVETVKGNYSLLGELQIELAGTAVGTGYDEVLVSGSTAYNATLSGTLSLDWTNFTGSTDATQLWILKNDTAGTLSGAFSNYVSGASLGLHDRRSWYLYYNADAATGNLTGGNDVLISPVPEPATIVLLVVAFLAALLWRRKM